MGFYLHDTMFKEIAEAAEKVVGKSVYTQLNADTGEDRYTWIIRTDDSGYAGHVATFTLCPLPGNDRFLTSVWADVNRAYRGKGLGQELHRLRIEIARKGEAAAMLCTVHQSNQAQIHILQKFDWQLTYVPSDYVYFGMKLL